MLILQCKFDGMLNKLRSDLEQEQRALRESLDKLERDVGDRLAIKNGIAQRFDTEADGNEFLNQTSEAKLARAIDIGEEEDEDQNDDGDKRDKRDAAEDDGE